MARLCWLVVMFVMSLISGLHFQNPWEETGSERTSPSSRTLPVCEDRRRVNCGVRPGFGATNDALDKIIGGTGDGLDKIIGGTDAQAGEIPWIARVQKIVWVDGRPQSRPQCAGVIVNEYWILTAALCTSTTSPLSDFRIVVGNRNVDVWEEGQQEFNVTAFFPHPDFRGGATYFDYNIALYKIALTSDGCGIRYNNNVMPICLPNPNLIFPNTQMVLTGGWGNTVNGEEGVSPVLKRIDLAVINVDHCGENVFYREVLTERMFCAGEYRGSQDACAADIGGPAVFGSIEGYVLLGIISHGTLCYPPNTMVVMTYVPMYYSWVKDTINANSAEGENVLSDDNDIEENVFPDDNVIE
ncbi:hypothetical protein BsWGS_27130 [Bradybaena similaris]